MEPARRDHAADVAHPRLGRKVRRADSAGRGHRLTTRILVTGATGFIGGHAVEVLRQRRVEVLGIGHEVDLLSAPNHVARVLRQFRPTDLLHLAWYAAPGDCWTSIENYRWAAATIELARCFAESGGRRIVGAGSCIEYDDGAGLRRESETPLRPKWPYGVCKDAARRLLESFAGGSGLSFAWGRVFYVYGPRERPDRLVTSVVQALLAGAPARRPAAPQNPALPPHPPPPPPLLAPP